MVANRRKRSQMVANGCKRSQMVANRRKWSQTIANDRKRLQMVVKGRKGSQAIANRRKRSQMVANGRKRSQMVANRHKRPQTVTNDRKWLQVVANGRKRLQIVTNEVLIGTECLYWPAPATLAQHLTNIGSMSACNRRQTSCYSQQTRNICVTFVQRRPNVFDALYKCYTNVLCLLG